MVSHRRGVVVRLWLLLICCSPVFADGPALPGPATAAARQSTVTALLEGREPAGVAELKAMEKLVQAVSKKVTPATVAIRVAAAHGSGVIINSEGYVLTAAHVAGAPGRDAWIRLHDGQEVRGTTLGVFRTLDAGLIKITTGSSGWPHAELGDSDNLARGAWCLATGHPGGFENGRFPVLRLGRVLKVKQDSINTDCVLIGGDSGGPLFDVNGRVIGIHSRIGEDFTANLHVPVNAFRQYREQQVWTWLVAGDAWGRLPGSDEPGIEPYIGVSGDPEHTTAQITAVTPGTPAEQANVKVGDIITRFAGRKVINFASLQALVQDRQPGERVVVEVLRDGRALRKELTVGEREVRE